MSVTMTLIPTPMQHLECGAKWDQFSVELPPRIIVCTGCHAKLKLIGYDSDSGISAYRRI